MTKEKVTDLEKFALEQIVRPYQNLLGIEERAEKLPYTLNELATMLGQNTIWSNSVLERIFRCAFYFPNYVVHPLVNVVRDYRPGLGIESDNVPQDTI